MRDTRRLRRLATSIILPVGPLAIAGVRLIMPYRTVDDHAAAVAKIADKPAAEHAVLAIGLVGILTLLPGVLAAGRVAMRRAPGWATAAMALCIPAFLALGFFGEDGVMLAGAEGGPALQAAAAKLLDASSGLTVMALAGWIYVIGHIFGLGLLGVAHFKARTLPPPVAIGLAASQPLHFVFAVIVPNGPCDAAAWSLTALAFALCAKRIATMPDDEWDLPPLAG